MITYMSASKTLDFIIEGIEEYIGVTIIASQSSRVRDMIVDKLGRGVTVYKGEGGYAKNGISKEMDIIYTVITRLEVNKLNTEIEKITTFISIIISPIVAPNFLLKKIASTSVPSITAPPLIARPIPAPRKNPPKIATNKSSSVTFGKETIATQSAKPVIAKAVFMANCFPKILYPKKIKGILIQIIRI